MSFGQTEIKKILNAMLKPMEINFTVANFMGRLFKRKRANGMAVKASIPRIMANHKMYSG